MQPLPLPTPAAPVFRAVADSAVLAEFGSRIEIPAHQAVLRLDEARTIQALAVGAALATRAERRLREAYDYEGTAIKVVYRARTEDDSRS